MIKTALVTGAANRIGAQIITTLHTQHYNVIVHYKHSKQAADDLVAQLNAKRLNSAQAMYADLANIKDVKQLSANISHINLLVNNASLFYPKSIQNSKPEDWDNLFNSNLKGAFFLSQQLYNKLKKSQGCIINMVDIYARRPLKNHAIYNIAKAGVAMMTKTLAKEFAPDIRVNGVSPGSILWPEKPLEEKIKQQMLDNIPLKRQGTPIDIAQTVHFLANANYITGQILSVDGGRTLNQ